MPEMHCALCGSSECNRCPIPLRTDQQIRVEFEIASLRMERTSTLNRVSEIQNRMAALLGQLPAERRAEWIALDGSANARVALPEA